MKHAVSLTKDAVGLWKIMHILMLISQEPQQYRLTSRAVKKEYSFQMLGIAELFWEETVQQSPCRGIKLHTEVQKDVEFGKPGLEFSQ